MLGEIYSKEIKTINVSVQSIDKTVGNIYAHQKKQFQVEQSNRRSDRQDAKRKAGDSNLLKDISETLKNQKKKEDKKDDKKSGGFLKALAAMLGLNALKDLILGSFNKILGALFGKKGLLANTFRVMFGKNGLVHLLLRGLFGKNGLAHTAFKGLFGKKGILSGLFKNLFGKEGSITKFFNKTFGKDGSLSKLFNKTKTVLDDVFKGIIKKFPKLGKAFDSLGKKFGSLGKIFKGAKGGGILSAVVSGGLKFAETGDTGQAVTQGAGAGAGALAGGAIGSLIAPGIGTAIGAAIGGIAGDFLTEELRKMGWLKPIEDTINQFVDVIRKGFEWMQPFFDGMKEGLNEYWKEIKLTFKALKIIFDKIASKFNDFISNVWEKLKKAFVAVTDKFNDVKDVLGNWWVDFNKNILVPVGKAFGSLLEFLDPILKPLKQLALVIISPLVDGFKAIGNAIKSAFDIIKKFIPGMDGDGRFNAGKAVVDVATAPTRFLMDLIQRAAGIDQTETQGLQVGGRIFGPVTKTPVKVPGSGSGDKVLAKLKPGSFVLNREASKVLGRQKGGLVSAMLEPGEFVFPKTTKQLEELNSAIPRFQTGGQVSHPDTGSGYQPGDATDASGRPVVLSKEAAASFKKMMDAGGVKGSDVASSRRSVKKNEEVGGVPNSAHLYGNAIDIHGASKAWLIGNSKKYGWVRNNYMPDSWHWDFKGGVSLPINEGSDDRKENKDTEKDSLLPENLFSNATKSIGGSITSGFGQIGGMINFLSMMGMDLSGMISNVKNIFGFGGGAEGGSNFNLMGPIQDTFSLGGGSGEVKGGDTAKSNEPYEIAASMGFSRKDWDIFRNVVGNIESGNRYNPSNDKGGGSGGHYDGRWQLGAAAKTDAASYLGEKDPGHGSPGSKARMAYRRDEEMQERYFAAFTAKNHSYLSGTPEYDRLSTKEKFEVLGYAHNQGAGGARDWLLTGNVRRDGFGTSATKYSQALSAAYGKQKGGIIESKKGGMTTALLEPGEFVFPSATPELEALNSAVPRFQTGGTVNLSSSGSETMNKLGQASGMSMSQSSVIVINAGGGNNNKPVQKVRSTPPAMAGDAPKVPSLPDGPSMTGLSDIINRVSWSSVF